MVMQTGKSTLVSRLGDKAKKTFETNKAKVETPFDMGELPGGCSGIAQLARCGFTPITEVKPTDKHGGKIGDYWFNAMGVVVDPVWWTDDNGNKVRIAGKQTRIIEACFDTPRKNEKGRAGQEEHLDWIIRQLKFLMGGTLEEFTVNDLEMVCEMLTKQKPYFAFTISEGTPSPQYPKPMKFHNWNGRVDDFAPPTNQGMMKDNISKPTNGSAQNNTTNQPNNHVPPSSTFSQEKQRNIAPTSPDQEFDEFGDLDSLVQRASDGDQEARAELTELATKTGVPAEDVKDADTWEEVATLIKDQQSEGAAAEGTQPEEENNEVVKTILPKTGTVYQYLPKDKRKPIDVLCVKVNTKSNKCSLKNMATEQVYDDVPWDKVLPPS